MSENTQLTPPEATSDSLILTPEASKQVKHLIELENEPSLFLRLGISSGGCSGMSYSMTLDDKPSDDDKQFEFEGVKVHVSSKAWPYLTGTTIDYIDSMMDGGFKFINPNASRSCGCGSSFSC